MVRLSNKIPTSFEPKDERTRRIFIIDVVLFLKKNFEQNH